jgi:predicted ATP-grasp superfamily ATP-dependent carboligase
MNGILLADPDFYGTLAAVRCLGAAGVPVLVARSRLLAPSLWSRYAVRRVPLPLPADPSAFVAALVAFGEREPGLVLYPTSDDLSWILAAHRSSLAARFRLPAPGVDTVYALLNKRRLCAVAAEVGLETPATAFPSDLAELDRVGRHVRYPVLVKPQSQVLFRSRLKGRIARDPEELRLRWKELRAAGGYGPDLLAYDPGVADPMVQAYHPEAAHGIQSVSGWVGKEQSVFRAATKVLQRPRRLGIGLCFEHAEVDARLAGRLEALCRAVGYHGVVEAEFIAVGERRLLIDVNPRFYSQLAFDVARGLPLPRLAYHDVRGEQAEVEALVEQARAWRPGGAEGYAHGFLLEVMLRAQRLSGALSHGEARAWRRWCSERRGHLVDAAVEARDWAPGVVDVAQHLAAFARHPRAFVRSIVFDRDR